MRCRAAMRRSTRPRHEFRRARPHAPRPSRVPVKRRIGRVARPVDADTAPPRDPATTGAAGKPAGAVRAAPNTRGVQVAAATRASAPNHSGRHQHLLARGPNGVRRGMRAPLHAHLMLVSMRQLRSRSPRGREVVDLHMRQIEGNRDVTEALSTPITPCTPAADRQRVRDRCHTSICVDRSNWNAARSFRRESARIRCLAAMRCASLGKQPLAIVIQCDRATTVFAGSACTNAMVGRRASGRVARAITGDPANVAEPSRQERCASSAGYAARLRSGGRQPARCRFPSRPSVRLESP